MVAQKEDVLLKDGKSELDLGIERSIRRCEDLLSMVPISLQSTFADGAFKRVSLRKDVAVPQFESKLSGLEFEWTRNMGLLSGMNPSTVDESDTRSIDDSAFSEKLLEKPQNRMLISAPSKSTSNSSLSSQQVNCTPLQGGVRGATDEVFLKKIHVKRRCARSNDGLHTVSASEDWTVNFSETSGTTTSTSLSGTQNDHGVEFARVEGAKESSPNKESEKQTKSGMGSSFRMEKNDKKTFLICGEAVQMEDVSQLKPHLPSKTVSPTEGGEAEKLGTRKVGISMHSNTSRSSEGTFEAPCFTSTSPKNCEEAWEWLDKRSNVQNILPSDLNYEGGVIHETNLETSDKKVQHLLRPRLQSDGKILDQLHLSLKSAEKTATLKPRGTTTNSRRTQEMPAMDRAIRCQDGRQTLSRESHKLGTTDGKLKTHVAAMARLRRLAKPRTALHQRCAQIRALKEEEQMSECSFKPNVGRRPSPGSPLLVPIFDRIGEMKQRIELRKRARKIIEKEELEQCSFRPKINLTSVYLDKEAYQPIQERLQELLRKRHERIALARAQDAKEKGLTFKPAINRKSVRLFKQKGLEAIKVSDRLSSSTPSPSDGHGDCRARKYRPKDECTFAPEINPNTDYILSGSALDGFSFLTRQQQFLRRLEQRKKQKEMELPCGHTFRPNIGNASMILQCSTLQDGNEKTLNERLERLSHRDNQRRYYIRQKISDNYYSQFKFQPKIDQMSKILSASTNLHELYKNEKGKRTKEALQQAAEQEFVQTCTFHPEVNTRKSAISVDSVLRNRRKFREDKAKNFEQLRLQMEMQEVKECTFKPDVHPVPPKEKEPVVIKGLGRHLELQDLAKQMKKEQEEWERKVFLTRVHDLPKRQYTIPKPFTLHSGRTTQKVTAPQNDINNLPATPKTICSSGSDHAESDGNTKIDSCSNMSICTSSCEKRETECNTL